jgi:hypothetical protein
VVEMVLVHVGVFLDIGQHPLSILSQGLFNSLITRNVELVL